MNETRLVLLNFVVPRIPGTKVNRVKHIYLSDFPSLPRHGWTASKHSHYGNMWVVCWLQVQLR